jgi:hypothetical protein
LELFKEEINDFKVYDVRDPSKKVVPEWPFDRDVEKYKIDFASPIYRAENYRLEFNSTGKSREEFFSDLSTGTQDIFVTLLELYAKIGNPLLAIEELENGVHPSLYRKVLAIIERVCSEKRVLVTTHSPVVARHFSKRSFESLYVGLPSWDGFAEFRALNGDKKSEIIEKAKLHSKSIGELIIDMLSESKASIDELKGWLRD